MSVINCRSLGVCTLAALAIVSGCGSSKSSTTTGSVPKVTIADKGFTESRVVTQAYRKALESAGFPVTVKSLTSTAVADSALRSGDIDMYSEYTATIVTTLLKEPTAPTTVNDQVTIIRQKYEPVGLTVLDAAPFNNDNEVACTKAAVDQFQLTDLTSLGKQSDKISYSANPEHTTRADGLPLLERDYGIKFKNVVTVDIGLRYNPIEQGSAQCVYAFGTDPKVAADHLVVLKDDKGTFQGAPYQGIPVVSQKFLANAPASFKDVVNKVSAALTTDEVRQMNAAVDIDKKDPDIVAEAFVKAKGLVNA
jgi:osmoprotectant transport system substrate-binding protein